MQQRKALKWLSRAVLAMAALVATAAADAQPAMPHWSASALDQLEAWARAAPDDALPLPDLAPLERARQEGDAEVIDKTARAVALALARAHLLGIARSDERKDWRIDDSDKAIDVEAMLAGAVADDRVDALFASLQPRHPDYARLRGAYLAESDPALRAVLARNMERWRWLPHSLGEDYLLVNAAAFEARLWRHGEQAGAWRVIVGKTKTPTPVFTTTITGVIINPWWDVPKSIVKESIGALIRRNPALARERGYVWGGGKVRQKPGEGNALGRMKLVMPNAYGVYLHDTPNRELFALDQRAFSHGCVRVGDALGLATTLLDGAKTREELDALVEAGETVTLSLPRTVPVYVTYFTAGVRGDGSFGLFPDIYKRDEAIKVPALAVRDCDRPKRG